MMGAVCGLEYTGLVQFSKGAILMHSKEKFLPQRRKFISSPLTLGLASAGVIGLGLSPC